MQPAEGVGYCRDDKPIAGLNVKPCRVEQALVRRTLEAEDHLVGFERVLGASNWFEELGRLVPTNP